MIGAQVAKKYGTALFQVAQKTGQVEDYYQDLRAIRQYVAKDDAFLSFIQAPQIPDADKAQVMKTAFFERVERVVYEFLVVLNDRRRLPYIAEIVDYFEQLYLQEIGVVQARVITAVPLVESELSAMQARLEKLTGKTVRTKTKVEPAIIGGVIVMLGNQVIDKSVRYQLLRLKERLLALKVH